MSPPLPPKRIVSLVPSQTELLAALSLHQEVCGITKFCVHPPEWKKEKTIVGGTKDFKTDQIKALHPDLIIGNKEENDRERIGILQKEFPVWISDINSLEDALDMITSLGEITYRKKEADTIAAAIQNSFTDFPIHTGHCSALYLIWRNPWMGVARNTFIHSMLELVGLKNCLAEQERYPTLSSDAISASDPDLILLSSEPYPFRKKHIQELTRLCPHARVLLVDGELFSWYGSRLLKTADYFRSLLPLIR